MDEGRLRDAANGDEAPRVDSFCAHAVLDDETLVVPDATRDPRFTENSMGLGFYAARR